MHCDSAIDSAVASHTIDHMYYPIIVDFWGKKMFELLRKDKKNRKTDQPNFKPIQCFEGQY